MKVDSFTEFLKFSTKLNKWCIDQAAKNLPNDQLSLKQFIVVKIREAGGVYKWKRGQIVETYE